MIPAIPHAVAEGDFDLQSGVAFGFVSVLLLHASSIHTFDFE